MRYRINLKEDLKKLFLPLDGIRISLIVVAFLMLFGTIYYLIRDIIGDFSWFSNPRINIIFSVMVVLTLLSILIIIAQVLSKHALSKFL